MGAAGSQVIESFERGVRGLDEGGGVGPRVIIGRLVDLPNSL